MRACCRGRWKFQQPTSVSIAENIKLNCVGARTQPCLKPLETGKDSDGSLNQELGLACPHWTGERWWWICGAAKLAHDFPQSLSADCVESIVEIHKGGERSQCCSIHFSWRWRAVNNMSTVPWPARKKHWLSGRRPYSRWWRRRLSSTRAKTLPAMERREIPRWLSQECRFPLLW